MVSSKEFARKIWSLSKGDWVFVPHMRDGSRWVEGKALHKEQDYFPIDPTCDVYFTPLSYVSPQRKAGNLGDPGVMFADVDSRIDPRLLSDLPPSAVVQTSAGHSHMYWFLRNPVAPQRWATANKGLTKMIGADPAGWDATQVLRIPGTENYKHTPPEQVRLIRWMPERVFDIEQFPVANDIVSQVTIEATPPVSKAERDYLIKAGIEDDRLPLASRYWLTAGTWEIEALGSIDRSKIMWGLEKNLLAHGYTPYEVFQLMHFSAINKWVGAPSKLWREVCKAAGVS